MANMSYCRFENTYRDLVDCKESMTDFAEEQEEGPLSKSEKAFTARLIEVCREIVELADMDKEDGVDVDEDGDED